MSDKPPINFAVYPEIENKLLASQLARAAYLTAILILTMPS